MKKALAIVFFAFLIVSNISCKKNRHNEDDATPFGIAVVVEKNNVPELWYMAADGTSFNKVYENSLGLTDVSGNPAWSSDGRKIYFVKNGDQPGVNGIYRVKPDGSDLTPVYTDDETQTRKFYHINSAGNDQHIVFSYDIPRNGRKAIEIYRMCPCGQRVNRLTTFEIDKEHPGKYLSTEAYAGSFSKDSKTLLVCQADPSITGKKDVKIMAIDIENPENIKLISTVKAADVAGCSPSLSPDGKKILLSVDGNIFSMNADGSNKKQLGELKGFRPVWDKNSEDFYFSSYTIPNMEQGIYKANIQLTKLEIISRKPGAGTYCGFSLNK